jgi:hypothetical protein
MPSTHLQHVKFLLADAAADHSRLLGQLPAEIAASLPVDAQGITKAIDYVAVEIGFSASQRRALVLPHAINPAVLHARVFGASGLTEATVLGAFVEGARVRAETLAELADQIGGAELGAEVRGELADSPPPVSPDTPGLVPALRATYAAQERAVLTLAGALDQLDEN